MAFANEYDFDSPEVTYPYVAQSYIDADLVPGNRL